MYIISLLWLIIVIAINFLANIIPLNGQTTGEISNRLPVLFTPASYVFSIWAIIYILLFIWIIKMRRGDTSHWRLHKQRLSLINISGIFNILWIASWHYEYFTISVLLMISLLITLILLYKTYPYIRNKWYERAPISLYLGWIIVAVVANISYLLTYISWSGFGLSDALWTVIMMTIATALVMHMRFHQHDFVIPAVAVWAIIGIAIKNEFEELLVSSSALFLAITILFSIIFIKKGTSHSD